MNHIVMSFSNELIQNLVRIKELKDGWLNQEGVGMDRETYDTLLTLLTAFCNIPNYFEPDITPTPLGGVDLVWYTTNIQPHVECSEKIIILAILTPNKKLYLNVISEPYSVDTIEDIMKVREKISTYF
jgi:hypothetical protein